MAERRRLKLEQIQRQLEDGSLKLGDVTPEDRRSDPATPANAWRR